MQYSLESDVFTAYFAHLVRLADDLPTAVEPTVEFD